MDAVFRPDRQLNFAKPRLRTGVNGFGRRLLRGCILGGGLRAAGKNGKRGGYCSGSPGSRSSTAVSPFELGAILASSICPGCNSGRCDMRTVSM